MMQTFRAVIPLLIGLVIGGTGAILFLQSMPPPEGSPEEKIQSLELELKKVTTRLNALNAVDGNGRPRAGRTVKDGLRSIAEDLRNGRPVTPEDVFRATQPLIRDLSPLFDRMRAKELQQRTDMLSGELARKYALNPVQQEALKSWLSQRAEEEAKRYMALVSQEGIGMEQLAEASRDIRLDEGLEQFMQGTLDPQTYATFKQDRMLEKVQNVQEEADMKIERIDKIVTLDDTQRGKIFGVLARGARDFDPAMQFEGLGDDTSALASGVSKQEAILSVLTPQQREAYDAAREKRRADAERELGGMGLSLPDDWQDQDFLEF